MSNKFPDDFIWGTATASYQVEGAFDEDGRGASIWDTFSKTPGKVLHGHSGDRACDQYHRYKEDVKLMADLGLGAYRFSLAWPRIYPDGYGSLNSKGFDYYNRLIDELLSHDIKPAVTLYHWDLPQKLQDQGGWPRRDTALRFADYAHTCFEALSSKVATWITLNEPFCSSINGYLTGNHAPGIRDRQAAYSAIHHLNLAHGLALQVFRQGGHKGRIGTTLNLKKPRPATRKPADLLAADRAADRDSRMFLDPLFGRGYPKRHLKEYPDVTIPAQEGDERIIAGRLDFLGINYYSEEAVAFDPDEPEQYRSVPTHYKKTDMGWDIVPGGLYRLLKWVDENYGHPEMYITENGCALQDILEGDRCHDPERIRYLKDHFKICAIALAEGIKLKGYYLWSFIDNFEWTFGYTKRFGIVYCDYVNMSRIPKDSYYYYREVIAGHEP